MIIISFRASVNCNCSMFLHFTFIFQRVKLGCSLIGIHTHNKINAFTLTCSLKTRRQAHTGAPINPPPPQKKRDPKLPNDLNQGEFTTKKNPTH